jgi:hypothetical protein
MRSACHVECGLTATHIGLADFTPQFFINRFKNQLQYLY